MTTESKQLLIMDYLKKLDAKYYGKIIELSERIEDWLSYIPQTFPHYTRHTIAHSREILLQISKLLFTDDDLEKPVIRLSSAEAYILAAAAFLHDAGMVASDKEKAEILESRAWKEFVSEGGPGAKQWNAIIEFRKSNSQQATGDFLANIQIRYLIAQFIRKHHHERTANLILGGEAIFGDLDFGNLVLKRTIADVCASHGLRTYELWDKEKFPDRRDIDGVTVNVRFLCILLRLGDLLDMDYDRACPLLLNAACPLPADSLAHWTSYQRTTHRSTTPQRIELRAECRNQEEHRYIQDWCQWLVDEVKEARNLMFASSRHGNWSAPHVSLDGEDPTIVIRPDSNATYIPSNWRFQLDEEIVFQRLVKDVHLDPLSFVRELLQNALDANRCQMYLDLRSNGLTQPEFPTQVAEQNRRRYPVKVSLYEKSFLNYLSGELELRQVLAVEDFGIGMDKDIIEKYFLQIGRSFYTTDDFARNFSFYPSSRFGIGFLSVFAVSDNVKVETFKPSSPSQDGPLRLNLTGPRNYLLLERGDRQCPGTRVEVVLNNMLERGVLTHALSYWCRRVEFPVTVSDLYEETTLMPEKAEDFTYEMPDVAKEGAKMGVRSFAIDSFGIEGEFYVFVTSDEKGERWDMWDWAYETYPSLHPLAKQPTLPDDLVCVNGISVGTHVPRTTDSESKYAGHNIRHRVDYRKRIEERRISGLPYPEIFIEEPSVSSFLSNLLAKHLDGSELAKSQEGWKYKNRLFWDFQSWDFWKAVPSMVKAHRKGGVEYLSLERLAAANTVTILFDRPVRPRVHEKKQGAGNLPICENDEIHLFFDDLMFISKPLRNLLFENRKVSSTRWLSDRYLTVDFTSKLQNTDLVDYMRDSLRRPSIEKQVEVSDLGREDLCAFNIKPLDKILLNSSHLLTIWFMAIVDAEKRGMLTIDKETLRRTIDLFLEAVKWPSLEEETFLQYTKKWKTIPGLPQALLPPSLETLSVEEVDFYKDQVFWSQGLRFPRGLANPSRTHS